MRRNLRRLIWFFRGFGTKYARVIIAGLFLGISVFIFSSRFRHLLPSSAFTQKIGLVGRYTADDLPEEILAKISRGLTAITPEGSASAQLATHWQIKEEGTLYLFHLKKGLSWIDGSPFKSQDIQLDLKDVEIRTENDETLAFKLAEPFSPFPTILNRPLFKKGLLGLGPYQVKAIKSSGNFLQSIRLEKKDAAIIYKFYPTEKAAIMGFKLGEVNRLENIANLGDLANWKKIKVFPKIRNDQFVAVFFNTRDDLLAEKGVRQALTYAIAKPEGQSRALGPINPHSWAFNSQVKPYNQNLTRAKELLEESKIKEAKIELATTFSQLREAEKIKNAWESIGVTTNVRVVTTLPDNFQAFLVSQKIPPDPDQYTLWHSTQNTNITGYNNPKIDKLLEDGRRIGDWKERKAIYLDFQRFLVEDAPAAFLFHPTIYTISR